MRKMIVLLCGFWLIVGPAAAGLGGTSGNFLLMGGSAKGLAMGEAQVALADDASSIFWNPAGLSQMSFPELRYMYNQWFIDITHQHFSFAYPTENGTFGGSYSLLDSGDIQGYSATGSREATFRAQDSALTFSWGRRLTDRLSAGVSLKTISESLENYSANSIALDGGVVFDLTSKLRFGAAIQNVGQPLKFISEDAPLPLTYRAGLGVRNRVRGEDRLSLGVDYVNNSNMPYLAVGVEYLFRELLALRAGISKGALNAGVGLKAALFGLDYAYLSRDDLGTSHRVGLSYSFGSVDVKKARVKEYLIIGKAYYDQGKFAEAVVAAENAVQIDPESAEAKALLTKARRALEGGAVEKVKEEIEAEKEKEVQVFLNNGKKFMAEEQYLEAIMEFNKALKILPSHPETVKLIREAQNALEGEVTERVKEEAREHLGLALKYITTQDYPAAMKEVEEVLKIDPGNVQALKLYRKLKTIIELEKE